MKRKTIKATKSAPAPGVPDVLGGANPTDTTAACPTGLSDPTQIESIQRAGGGGAPATGAQDPDVNAVPKESATEDEFEQSGKRKDSRGQDMG